MRIRELDGIRGLAAAQVVASHVLGASQVTFPGVGVLATVIDGSSAVILFFVLSGLCLSLPFFGDRRLNVAEFYCRRVFRIYPAFLVSLAVALLALALYPQLIVAATDDLGAGQTLGTLQTAAPWGGWTVGNIARFAALIYPLTDYRTVLNHGAVWSLVIEMRISIILPAVILLVLWSRSRRGLIGGLAVLLAAQLIEPAFSRSWMTVLWNQLFWITIFLVGVVAAKYLAALVPALARAPAPARFLLAAGALALYFMAPLVVDTAHYLRFSTIVALASLGLILAALCLRPLGAWLDSPLPQFLGQISYSLYLLHWPFYTLMREALQPALGLPAALAIYLPATILGAYLAARFVEVPFIRLGGIVGTWARLRSSSWRSALAVKERRAARTL
jgi:peptidoglycan/LPS O-acetylase OafA/YrhL